MSSLRASTRHRTVAWNKDGKVGAEFALIDFGPCSAMNCTAPAGRRICS